MIKNENKAFKDDAIQKQYETILNQAQEEFEIKPFFQANLSKYRLAKYLSYVLQLISLILAVPFFVWVSQSLTTIFIVAVFIAICLLVLVETVKRFFIKPVFVSWVSKQPVQWGYAVLFTMFIALSFFSSGNGSTVWNSEIKEVKIKKESKIDSSGIRKRILAEYAPFIATATKSYNLAKEDAEKYKKSVQYMGVVSRDYKEEYTKYTGNQNNCLKKLQGIQNAQDSSLQVAFKKAELSIKQKAKNIEQTSNFAWYIFLVFNILSEFFFLVCLHYTVKFRYKTRVLANQNQTEVETLNNQENTGFSEGLENKLDKKPIVKEKEIVLKPNTVLNKKPSFVDYDKQELKEGDLVTIDGVKKVMVLGRGGKAKARTKKEIQQRLANAQTTESKNRYKALLEIVTD